MLTKFGKIYKLSNFDFNKLNDTALNNSSINETLLNNIVLERVINQTHNRECNCLLVLEIGDEVIMIVAAGSNVYIYQNMSCSEIKLQDNIKALCNLEDYIIALTCSNQIIEICPVTKLTFYNDSSSVDAEHIALLDNNSNEIELLILSTPDGDNDKSLKILDFPSLVCKTDLHIDFDVWPVQQPKCSINLFYILGNRDEQGLLYELEMKKISETEPTQRLLKLLQRGMFTEAEEFALQFELSIQPVLEGRARKLCASVGKQMTDSTKEMLKLLFELLEKIESNSFLASLTDLEIPDRHLSERYLYFIIGRLNITEYPQQIKRLNEKLLRLETLRLFDPNETYLQWPTFIHHTNLKDLCLKMFKSEFVVASLIWARHTSCILPYLDVVHVENLLNSIPNSATPIDITNWLKHFVPNVLQALPEMMESLVVWSIAKMKSMFRFSIYWPEIGLEFMNNIKLIFYDVQFIYPNLQRKYETVLEQIQETIYVLEDLSVLHKTYNLNVDIDHYIKDSMEDTALYLLKRIQLTNLKAFVKTFLIPIYKEKGKTADNAIKRYANFVVANKHFIDWAERMVTIVELIHNEDDKLTIVLSVLKNAPVPWPEALLPLIKYGGRNHPLASEIYVEHKHQKTKVLRTKYGWPLDYVEMPGDRLKFVQRILKMKQPQMIQDLRVVIEGTPEIAAQANFCIIRMFTKEGRVEAALKYIEDLPIPEMKLCCDSVVMTFVVS